MPAGVALTEASGLTDYFARTAVLNVIEDVHKDTESDQEYESPSVVLWWVRRPERYAIAAGSPEAIARARDLHISLRRRLRDLPELGQVVRKCREVQEVRAKLEKELERISHSALFPSTCQLCQNLANTR